ncbi:MAG: response regulator [Alphaproteobacteria bacterium]
MAHILIAEDEDAVREFLIRALGHKGHEVTAVADGSAALEALHKASFDLLLTDIVMPQLDGVTLALKASKDFPDLRIVLMTGYASERQRAYDLDALVHQVVDKPFTMEEICAVVDAALAA